MKKKVIFVQLLVIIIAFMGMFSSISYGTGEMYTWQVSANLTSNNKENINNINNEINKNNNDLQCENNCNVLPTVAEIENKNTLNLTSGAGILIEQSTGQVLYAHNIHEKLRPASVTKVMTILLIMEQIDKRKFSIYRYNCMFSKCKQHGRFTNMVRSERTTYSR